MRFGKTVSIDVDIDVDDVLHALSKKELAEVLADWRDSLPDDDNLLEEVLHSLYRGDVVEATATLERLIYPKFPDAEVARKRYAEAMERLS